MARHEMDAQFTAEEQRFVLAEMIKSSSIDVEHIANFVKSNDVNPDWMNMQLPRGRNMNQCIAAAEHLSLSILPYYPHYHNPRLPQATYAAVARRSTPGTTSEHHMPPLLPQPPPYSHQVPILPRPVNGTTQRQTRTPSTEPPRAAAQPAPKKKRGRPSRADRASRDLRPVLPAHLMPRPSTEPRPILPAAAARTLPPLNHGTAATTAQGTVRGKKRRRGASAGAEAETEAAPTKVEIIPGTGSSTGGGAGAGAGVGAPERHD